MHRHFGRMMAIKKNIKLAEECIQTAWDNHPRHAQNCFGRIADQCLDREKDHSTAGQVHCSHTEYLAWDFLLNQYYRDIMAQTTDIQKKSLRDTQRLWIKYKQEKCHYWRTLIDGTMASPIIVSCQSQMTFDRVIDFLGYKRYLSM